MLLTLLGAPGALRHMQPEKLLTSPAAQTATAPRGRKEPANSGSTHTTGDVVNSLFFFFTTFIYFFIWLCCILVVAGGVFACSMRTLSCSIRDLAA